ncbi:CDPK-related kinase 2-like [Cucurbita pepo subsp. pepo]|uniref:CDPK-related kinase 2-like n=1 Tax=Cucurbita pepo subsp. pepo TaxID=3664 RepID=UPI000C9D909F|nr:CDPK-related kinase 2-like [Cucurbita pepo subsp. pepo]
MGHLCSKSVSDVNHDTGISGGSHTRSSHSGASPIAYGDMTSAVGIEDVRREVKILKALSGHKNLVQFHDAFEDANNIYMVMELCEGGELLERIVSRGGRYPEQESKTILVQILNVVAFFHLQGVVHRDLKPENFLFVKKDENTGLKVIDFGLSDFVKPGKNFWSLCMFLALFCSLNICI